MERLRILSLLCFFYISVYFIPSYGKEFIFGNKGTQSIPVQSDQLTFSLIPHEPGPTWNCIHKPVINLPNDWRVYCQSTNSSARAQFLVHFLVRQMGAAKSILEILYWVDEYTSTRGSSGILSYGQSSLIELTNINPLSRVSLGQFVHNGTSSLNLIYSFN